MKLKSPSFTFRKAGACALTILFSIAASHAASATWSGTVAGNWSDPAQWTPAAAPGDVSGTTNADVATFASAGVAVTVDSYRNVSGITFNGGTTAGWTLQTGTLHLTNGGAISVTGAGSAATNAISSPIVLEGDGGAYSFSHNSSTATRVLTISGNISGVSSSGNTTALALNGSNTSASNLLSGIVSDGANGGKLSITKSGAGTWGLTGLNTYSGDTTLSAGTLVIGGAGTGTAGAPTNGPLGKSVLYANGGTIQFATNTTIYNNIVTATGSVTNINEVTAAVNLDVKGNISGSGSIFASSSANYGGTRLGGDNSGFTGTFTFNSSTSARHKFTSATAGSAAAKWVLNGATDSPSAALGATGTIQLGELSGTAGNVRNNSSGTTTFEVGALNTNSTWAGVFSNVGTLALKKVGSGTLTVTAANTYTGATTVNGGTLYFSTGSNANSDTTVNSTGTLKVDSGKTLKSLAVTAGGKLQAAGATTTVSGAASFTGASATLDLVNSAATSTFYASNASGLTLGGASSGDTAQVNLEVGASQDAIAVTNALNVDAGGANITITNQGLTAGTTYPIITFASGTGAGFATGTGTTVGALTLTNPNLSFGITGTLEVTATGVNLVTSGATAPAEAYWSGANGSHWNDTSGSNANFTTTAAATGWLNVLPATDTQVYFSNNSASNLTNSLGANFSLLGITYRGASGAVTTSDNTYSLTLGANGITQESGNPGSSFASNTLTLSADQTWDNQSSNPLTVASTTVNGSLYNLTLDGTGDIHLGGTSLTANSLTLNTNLDVEGTSLTTSIYSSAKNITNTGAANAVLNLSVTSPVILSGIISDVATSTLAINKSGSDALTLSGVNTYTGGTTLTGGTLIAGDDAAFGTGSVTLSTSASDVLDLNGKSIANALNNNITGATITNTSASTATISNGFNAANAAGYIISDFTFTGTGDIHVTGSIRRTNTTGVIYKQGNNTLTLTDGSVVAGMNLNVNAGTVVVGQTATCCSDPVINGGTIKMDPNYQTATASIWAGTFGNILTMNGGTWDLNDTGLNGVSNRIKRIVGSGATPNGGGTITNTGTGNALFVLAARDVAAPVWAGNITDSKAQDPINNTGTVSMTLTNGGTNGQVMTFTGTHTHSGATTVDRQTLQAGAASVFSENSAYTLVNNSASVLDLNSFDNHIGSLTSVGANSKVTLGSATLTTGKNDLSTNYGGVISGTGGLTKIGTGTFTLSGLNTYTGNTTISDGELDLADNAKLTFSIGANHVSNKITGTGIVLLDGDFSLDLSAANLTAGNTWTLVDVSTLSETFGSTFTLVGFTETANVHTKVDGSNVWTFDEATGVLSLSISGYASWITGTFANGTVPSGQQGPLDDPDGDGINNLLEYAVDALDPTVGNGSLGTLSGMTVTFTKRALAVTNGDVNYAIEESTDLGLTDAWADVTPTTNTSTEISYTFPGSGTNARDFARLKVTKP